MCGRHDATVGHSSLHGTMGIMSAVRFHSRMSVIFLLVLALVANSWSASQTWLSFRNVDEAFLNLNRVVTGRQLSPAIAVLPLLAVAAVVAVIVGSVMWVRITAVVGMAVAGAGVGFAVAVLAGKAQTAAIRQSFAIASSAPSTTHALPVAVSLIGSVLFMAAGFLSVSQARSWSGLSRRYQRQPKSADGERVGDEAASDDAQMWAALDRGDDPTVVQSH